MTGYLTHDANLARLKDMHTAAASRRMNRMPAAPVADHAHSTECIAIRRTTDADRAVLERLAALDSAAALSGEILIAEIDDEALAAIEIATGVAIADPFRRTAHLVALLDLRATALREATTPRRRRGLRLRSRAAYRAT